MEIIRTFEYLSKDDVSIAGGKGASLGEMTRAGISVPDGFVILSDAFEKFIEETDLNVEIDSILHKVKHDDINSVESASEQIKSLIFNAKMSKDISNEIVKNFKKLGAKYVAVRSSATSEDSASAAWAGQLDSFLNTTEKNLLENVKKCWASLFTPRAIFYRIEKDLHKEKISVAVVVQKMIESEVSGITFSVHPVTQDRNQLIIEAGFGLGEAIVSGQITPDSYVIEKSPRRIIDKNIVKQEKGLFKVDKGGNEWISLSDVKGDKQKLNDKEILELSELILKIEKHYGFPCDIEFAKEKGKFYIVQSRPITTLIMELKILKEENKVFTELIHLDFPLIVAELTNYGESLKDIPWSKEKFTIKPYCLFERKNNSLYYIYDERGINWKIEQAGKFDKQIMVRNVLNSYNDVKDIIENEKSLNKEEFKEFVEKLKKFWTWWDCMWWMIEYYERNNLDFKDLLEIRKKTEHLAPGMAAVIRNSLKNIVPMKKKYIDVLLLDEIIDNKFPSNEILDKRMKGFVFTNGKLYDSMSKVKEEFSIEVREHTKTNKNILNGQIAYPGKVIGRVRIIEKRAQIKDFQKGEIIVSSSTTPDFLPAMKLSSAIISEHGGAISHAAITSRELKIPCIVGVKGATTLLKDGMEVEVDANNGVVRILKT